MSCDCLVIRLSNHRRALTQFFRAQGSTACPPVHAPGSRSLSLDFLSQSLPVPVLLPVLLLAFASYERSFFSPLFNFPPRLRRSHSFMHFSSSSSRPTLSVIRLQGQWSQEPLFCYHRSFLFARSSTPNRKCGKAIPSQNLTQVE